MASRTVTVKVEFDYNFDGTYTNESANLVSFRVERNLNGVGVPFTSSSGQIPKAIIVLRNTSNRFNSKISSGALYSDIGNGKFYRIPVKIYVNTSGSERLIFTGVAKGTSEQNKNLSGNTVTIECFGYEELLRDQEVSTSLTDFYTYRNGVLDSTIVSSLLGSYAKSVDTGSFTLLPSFYKQNLLSILWGIADLSGAYFFSNRSGTFKYKTLQSMIVASSVLTVTEANSSSISFSYVELDKFKSIKLSGNLYTEIPDVELCNIPYILVPADTVITYDVEFNDYCISVDNESYRAISNGGNDYTSSVSISRSDTAGGTTLTIDNNHATLQLAVINFTLTGKVIEKEKFSKTYTSAETFWTNRDTKIKEVSSDYLIESTMDYVGNRLLKSMEQPIARVVCNDVVTNTDIELFDLITVTDTSIADSNIKCFISGINYNYSMQSGLRLNITGIDIAHIAQYHNTSPGGYFVLGTNKLGSTNSLRGRLYF